MKTIISFAILVSITLTSFGTTFYKYTAKSDGNFSNMSTWNKVARIDGVQKDEFIIPNPFVVTADNNINSMGLVDLNLEIFGTFLMGNNVIVYFTNNTRIEIMGGGAIDGNGNSQQIFIGSVMKYEGNKNKTLTGLKFADNTTGVSPSGFSNFSILPVHFLSFDASKNNDNSVSLKWSTADEVNNNRFEIERKSNGSDWTIIGVCDANGKRTGINNYSFTDKSKAGLEINYRIKQVDNDGHSIYTAVVVVRQNGLKAEAKISSSNKIINIEFNQEINSGMTVKLFNLNGSLASNQCMVHGSKKMTINVSNLNKGIYVVQVTDNQNFQEVKKVSIN